MKNIARDNVTVGSASEGLAERRAASLPVALRALRALVEAWPASSSSAPILAVRRYLAGLTDERPARLCEVLAGLRSLTFMREAADLGDAFTFAHALAWHGCRSCMTDPAPRRLRKQLCPDCYQLFRPTLVQATPAEEEEARAA